jgi:hypothetical protein
MHLSTDKCINRKYIHSSAGIGILRPYVAFCNLQDNRVKKALGIFTLIFQTVMSEKKTGTEFDILISE